jgi:hypothetical protein
MERAMHCRQSVIPDLETACLSDPSQAPLDDVANLAQAAAVRRAWLGQMILDPPFLQSLVVAWRPVGAVPVQRLGLAMHMPAPVVDRRDVIEQRHRLERFVAVGAGDAHGQRGAVAIDEQVPFRAFFASIRGVFAGEYPPKTARYDWLSTLAFSQSISPSRPRQSSKACSSFFQTPRRCQYCRRRQQVTPEPQPISSGSNSQGMPLRRTKTMPVRQARSSTGGRPRFPGRALWRGSSGSMASQSSSGTRGPDMTRLQRRKTGYWSL